MMMISLTGNFPKYMLEYFESTEVLGYFSAVFYIIVLGNLVMNSISQNFLPKLSSIYIKREKGLFKKYVFVYLTLFSIGLGIITILATYIFGEYILTLFLWK